MARIESFDSPTLQAICDVLGDTRAGLTGTEIGNLLAECNIGDPLPGHTKRYRLYEAFQQRQTNDGCANGILHFIQTAMNPVRFVGNPHYYQSQRGRLNAVLAFAGLSLGEDGKLRRTEAAKTLSEAEERAGRPNRPQGSRRRVALLPCGASPRQLLSCCVRSHQECGRQDQNEDRIAVRWVDIG